MAIRGQMPVNHNQRVIRLSFLPHRFDHAIGGPPPNSIIARTIRVIDYGVPSVSFFEATAPPIVRCDAKTHVMLHRDAEPVSLLQIKGRPRFPPSLVDVVARHDRASS